jgi:hypothetical protein
MSNDDTVRALDGRVTPSGHRDGDDDYDPLFTVMRVFLGGRV